MWLFVPGPATKAHADTGAANLMVTSRVLPGSRCNHLEDDGSFWDDKPFALKNGGKGTCRVFVLKILHFLKWIPGEIGHKGPKLWGFHGGISMVSYWYFELYFLLIPQFVLKRLCLDFGRKYVDSKMISQASTVNSTYGQFPIISRWLAHVHLSGATAGLKHQQWVSQTCSKWVQFLSNYTHLKLGRICLDKLYTDIQLNTWNVSFCFSLFFEYLPFELEGLRFTSKG